MGGSGDRPGAQFSATQPRVSPCIASDSTYDALGRIATWRQENSGSAIPQTWDLGYDNADRLVSGILKNASTQAVLKEVVFGFDRADTRKWEQVDGMIASDTHNALNQLTGRGPGGWMRFRGTVDEPAVVSVAGNAASVTGAGVFEGSSPVSTGNNSISIVATDGSNNTRTSNFTVNATSSGNKTGSYDNNGNMLSDGTRTFLWDAANRLVRITYTGTNNRTEFVFDGVGRRVGLKEITSGSTTTDLKYLWAGLEIAQERNSAGSTVNKQFFPLGQRVGTANYFYFFDHLGSVREMTDGSGVVQARYDYDLWGRRTKLSGAQEAVFGFTGYFWHSRSGLHLAPYREYDADLGRWLSRDPIGEKAGVNLYAYVNANPIIEQCVIP